MLKLCQECGVVYEEDECPSCKAETTWRKKTGNELDLEARTLRTAELEWLHRKLRLAGIIDALRKQAEDIKKSSLVPSKLEKSTRLELARSLVEHVYGDCELAVQKLREALAPKEETVQRAGK